MGLVHYGASVTPSKQELVANWLSTRAWAAGRTIAAKLGEYRIDDPAGEVGVETIVWQTDDGARLQTPLTYRAAPLAGAEAHLIGTSEHSVLGTRWVYDGCGDPVWAQGLVATILTGGTETPMHVEIDGTRHTVPSRLPVRGSGGPDRRVPAITGIDDCRDEGQVTVVRVGAGELVLARVVGAPIDAPDTLTGQVGDTPVVLAGLRSA